MHHNEKRHNVKRLIDDFNYSNELISLLEKKSVAIVEQWCDYPSILTIRNKLHYSKEQYKQNVASRVLDYFFTLLRKENKAGDCPVMRAIVEEFHTRGFNIEDVFATCSVFKNILINLMIDSLEYTIKKQIPDIMMLLDYNLQNVLSMYSEKLEAQQKKIEQDKKIIEENVLYSRTDCKGKIIEVTDAFSKLTGYTKEELLGVTHGILRHKDVSNEQYAQLWKTIQSGKIWTGSLKNVKKDGSTFIATLKIVPVFNQEKDKIIEYMGFRNDITANELAKYDSLTHLYNRRSFDAIYKRLCEESTLKKYPLSLIIIDIDHFKKINDRFGHLQGDEVLKSFSKILLENTRSSDICARWGGEEFTILLPGSNGEKAYEIAERIRLSVAQKILLDGESVHCSLGIGQKIIHETDNQFFHRVDTCMYKAKQEGEIKQLVI